MKFLKLFRRSEPAQDDEPNDTTLEEDLELLYTLCTVWHGKHLAQEYMKTKNRFFAPMAAAEIRREIEASDLAGTEICQDHIRMLQAIERGV